MATPKSLYVQDGNNVDYTPAAAATAGAIVQQNGLAGQVVADLTAGELGALRVVGIVDVQKDATAITDGLQVGWDNDGTDVNGATGGALTSTVASMDFVVGIAQEAAGTAVADCKVALNTAPLIAEVTIANNTAGTVAAALAALEGTYVQATVANNFATLFSVLQTSGLIV